VISALALSTLLLSAQDRFKDTDNDGLPDIWETDGFGPIDPKIHGCSPNHADVFIVLRIRSTMKPEKIQPTLDRMKKFYAALNHKNPDGTTGLNMIPIVIPMPVDTDKKGYTQLYGEGMPPEWRGLAHGVLVDDTPGGGGQCNRPDWCGTGNNWMTMLHELGHQYGLPHEPMGARTNSPFHPSMMNYDYSYQLGGKGDAIQFSTGKFIPMRMKETDLNEVVPFPIADLQYLTSRPYYFKLQKIDEQRTAVDWNRNGIFGEKHVRADINDGYSAGYGRAVGLEFAAGATTLAAMGKTLAVVYPDLMKPEDYKTYALRALDRTTTGRLQIQLIENAKASKAAVLVDSGVAGDPTAVYADKQLWVSYPTATGYAIRSFRFKGGLAEPRVTIDRPDGGVQPTLVNTPEGLLVLITDEKTGAVRLSWVKGMRPLTPNSLSLAGGEGALLDGVTSEYPVGAVWNTKKKCLAICTPVKQGEKNGRLLIHHLTYQKGKWTQTEQIWVEGEKGTAATSWRPQIVFDASKDRGPEGAYNIFIKGGYPDPNQAGLNYQCKQIGDKTLGDGWRIKMMGNEWSNSRSVCGVTPYLGDIAYAVRWYAGTGGNEDARLSVCLGASGIENEWLTDFDEVGFIFDHGLADSLRSVQNEQWKPKAR
jgi:hypothetical protein